MEQREHLRAMLSGADEMLDTVDDMVDLAAIEAGTFDIRPGGIDALRTAQRACEPFRNEALRRELVLVIEADAALGTIVADEARLTKVLSRLAGYAVRASRRHGRVTVLVSPSGRGSFRLDVSGSTLGGSQPIDNPFAEDPPAAGEPRRYLGPGLGLPFIRRLVEACGGHVRARREPEGGTTLSAVLPSQQPRHTGD